MIETERLELIPLKLKQLRSWVDNLCELENELVCSYKAELMNGFFLDIVKGQLEKTERDPENYCWHSFWFLIRKDDRVVVGCADFKDVPNSIGEVEIGYGLGKEYEHKGYMTEAVKAMCHWALRQQGVSGVIAETELDGTASQKILERCGFVKYRHDATIWWRLQP